MKVQFFDIENWREIGATLAKNKTRTFLTGFGIFWGVFMLACLLGGARGAEDLLRRNFDGFATNSAVLVPGNTTMPYQGHAKGRAWDADLTDLERLRQLIPELDVVTTTVRDNVSLRHDRYSYSSQAWGAQEAFTDVMLPCIENGRFINTADEMLMRKVAVVGKKVANELYPGVVNPVGEQIQINGIVYTIVGIAYQTSEVQLGGRIDDVVIIPLSTFQKAFNLGEKVGMIMVVGNQNANLTLLESKFRHILYSRHQIAPTDDSALWYLNISERFSQLDSLFIGVSFLAGFIGISTLIAGIIGIGNIMWVIVKERTQEFGVRRAIGAKPADVTIQILSEGVTLTAVAGFAGITMACIALGVAQHLTANDISTPQFQMNIWQAGGIILVFAVLGTLAGLIPALKAMRIKPIEALNDK